MATHYSILPQRIPWTGEPGRLQSMGSQRVGHNWATNTHSEPVFNPYVSQSRASWLPQRPALRTWPAYLESKWICSINYKDLDQEHQVPMTHSWVNLMEERAHRKCPEKLLWVTWMRWRTWIGPGRKVRSCWGNRLSEATKIQMHELCFQEAICRLLTAGQ